MLSSRGFRSTVSCSNDLSLKIWDTNNEYKNIKTLHGHDHSVTSVKFVSNGDFLVTASRDKTIRIWEVSTGYVSRIVRKASAAAEVATPAISYCIRTLWGHDEWVRSVVPSGDGKWLLSASSDQVSSVVCSSQSDTSSSQGVISPPRRQESGIETKEMPKWCCVDTNMSSSARSLRRSQHMLQSES
jgi:WD40 repeat protein